MLLIAYFYKCYTEIQVRTLYMSIKFSLCYHLIMNTGLCILGPLAFRANISQLHALCWYFQQSISANSEDHAIATDVTRRHNNNVDIILF